MKQNLITLGMVLGIGLAATGLAARPSIPKSMIDAGKKDATCMVCGKKMDKEKAQKVLVKGKEQLVCSEACGKELSQNPDKYLNDDGSRKP